ncbi:MAG: hypothetical protein JWP29_3100 [Rhodoferax sp.]|nr:hypothetical protein [Rhodoferax sp.]
MVEAQRADAWVASFLNEKDFPLYPKWHFDRDIEVVIFKKEKAAGWTGTASLRDQKVGWMRDYGFDRYIREPMKISEVDHYDDAFKLLAAGRFDYFIAGQKDIDEVIKKTQTNTAPFDIRPLMNLGVYLAFANNARGGALRKIWDDEMETLHKTDAFKAAYKKYDQPYPFPLNN